MEVSNTLGAGGPAATSAASSSSTLGKDEFLKLLVAQLSHQDPLNPLEGHEFAAQLAQFTSVEQLTNINDGIANQSGVNSLLASSTNSGIAAGLIGKDVEADTNTVQWDSTGDRALQFELSSPATKVKVDIRDANGTVIRTIEKGLFDSGEHQLSWDGKNDAGVEVADGSYTFSVSATDRNDFPVGTRTFLEGTVDRVTFGPEGILLWVNGVANHMSGIRSVEDGG